MKSIRPVILIYGFGPYEQYSTNITESVIAAMGRHEEVSVLVFPVCFNSKVFRAALDRLRPDFIIGLGQHPRARKIRIERRVRNWMTPRRKLPGRAITTGKARRSFANLILPRLTGTTVTYDAGTFVCNYSMWQVSSWCELNGGYWAFLHIPRVASVTAVVQYLKRVSKGIRAAREQDNKRDSRPQRLSRYVVLESARTRY